MGQMVSWTIVDRLIDFFPTLFGSDLKQTRGRIECADGRSEQLAIECYTSCYTSPRNQQRRAFLRIMRRRKNVEKSVGPREDLTRGQVSPDAVLFQDLEPCAIEKSRCSCDHATKISGGTMFPYSF